MNKNFKMFVESIARTIKEVCRTDADDTDGRVLTASASSSGDSREIVSRVNCIFYEKSGRWCGALSKGISDPSKPLWEKVLYRGYWGLGSLA